MTRFPPGVGDLWIAAAATWLESGSKLSFGPYKFFGIVEMKLLSN
ncbi:hypothetical protein X734_31920 [Mesorhizobium sp. L2C084A000]|nr:hypothetical protein X734_31920 [Mesorhizobium sp. L2C084A000]